METKIKSLDSQFSNLHQRFCIGLKESKNVSTFELLHTLTLLPTTLKNEYESSIQEEPPKGKAASNVTALILCLSPLFSFNDYGLLEHLIQKFGSDSLNTELKAYVDRVKVFCSETTVRDLINFWPGRQDLPSKLSMLKAKLDLDPTLCKLEELNSIKKRFFSQLQLSHMICALVAVKEATLNSFFAIWAIPSTIVPELMEAACKIGTKFYQKKKIITISVDVKQLYPFISTQVFVLNIYIINISFLYY